MVQLGDLAAAVDGGRRGSGVGPPDRSSLACCARWRDTSSRLWGSGALFGLGPDAEPPAGLLRSPPAERLVLGRSAAAESAGADATASTGNCTPLARATCRCTDALVEVYVQPAWGDECVTCDVAAPASIPYR